MTIEKEKLIDMYRVMIRIREFEEVVRKGFAAGDIPGFVHMSQGQEAIPAGACANLRRDDYMTSNHRGHGHLLAKGGRTDIMMAEIFGRKTGFHKGKGGSMHLTDLDVGAISCDGILGTPLMIANGALVSARLLGTDQVALSFIGDGSLNTGGFHEGLNMASTWKLPLVYVCENNTYGNATFIYDTTNLTNLVDRALGYGIPGVAVDGNDVIAVYEVVAEAVARARRGEGPSLIECKTCRWYGHFEGDTQAYRPKGEVEECIKRDPIPRFKKKLIGMRVLTEKEVDKIHQEAVSEMERALTFAKESPFPGIEEVVTDVYV